MMRKLVGDEEAKRIKQDLEEGVKAGCEKPTWWLIERFEEAVDLLDTREATKQLLHDLRYGNQGCLERIGLTTIHYTEAELLNAILVWISNPKEA